MKKEILIKYLLPILFLSISSCNSNQNRIDYLERENAELKNHLNEVYSELHALEKINESQYHAEDLAPFFIDNPKRYETGKEYKWNMLLTAFNLSLNGEFVTHEYKCSSTLGNLISILFVSTSEGLKK